MGQFPTKFNDRHVDANFNELAFIGVVESDRKPIFVRRTQSKTPHKICREMGVKEHQFIRHELKKCDFCDVSFDIDSYRCPCCGRCLRTRRRNHKLKDKEVKRI